MLVAQEVKNLPAKGTTQVHPWVRSIPWGREWLLTLVFLPGEFHREAWLTTIPGVAELDMTEWLTHTPWVIKGGCGGDVSMGASFLVFLGWIGFKKFQSESWDLMRLLVKYSKRFSVFRIRILWTFSKLQLSCLEQRNSYNSLLHLAQLCFQPAINRIYTSAVSLEVGNFYIDRVTVSLSPLAQIEIFIIKW